MNQKQLLEALKKKLRERREWADRQSMVHDRVSARRAFYTGIESDCLHWLETIEKLERM